LIRRITTKDRGSPTRSELDFTSTGGHKDTRETEQKRKKRGKRDRERRVGPMEFKVEFEAWTFFGNIFDEATRGLDTFYTKG
jgi:hypothetical protein